SLRVENAMAPAQLVAEGERASGRGALSLWQALEFLPELRVRRAFEERARNGAAPRSHELVRPAGAPGRVRLASEDGRWFLAIGRAGGRNEPLTLEVVFARPVPAEVEAPLS